MYSFVSHVSCVQVVHFPTRATRKMRALKPSFMRHCAFHHSGPCYHVWHWFALGRTAYVIACRFGPEMRLSSISLSANFSDMEELEHMLGAAHVEQEVVVVVDDREDAKQ